MTARCEVRKLGMSRLMAGQVSAVVRGGHEWVKGLLDGQVKGGGGGEGQGRRVGGGERVEGGHRKGIQWICQVRCKDAVLANQVGEVVCEELLLLLFFI